jgi:hypothetical protein
MSIPAGSVKVSVRPVPPACRMDEGGLPLDHHLHRPGEDVPDFLTRMHVPARLDASWDLCEHLHDLPPRNRGHTVLEFSALELPRERVDRLLRVRHGIGRHGWTS